MHIHNIIYSFVCWQTVCVCHCVLSLQCTKALIWTICINYIHVSFIGWGFGTMWNQIPEARSRQVRMFWRWWKRRKDATWTKKHVWSLCFHNLMDKWFYLTSILGEELRKLLLQQGTLEQVEVQLEKQHVEEESDTLRGGWHSEASLAMEGWTTLLASFEAHIFWCIAILIFIYNYIDNTHTHIYIYI